MMSRRIFGVIAVISLLFAGCATRGRRASGFACSPGDPLMVQGDGVKFTPRDLEKLARQYVANEQVAFDFDDTMLQIWIFTDHRPVLAQLDWGSGLGKPQLGIEIDRQGKVTRHYTGIAACGTSFLSMGLDPSGKNQ